MKVGKRIGLILAAVGLLSFISLVGQGSFIARGQVIAQENVQTEEMHTQDAPESPSTTLESRLQKRKESLGLRLNAAQQTRLKTRCKGAQAVLGAYQKRMIIVQKNRVNAYDRIHDHTSMLIDKLEGQVDTSKLQAAEKTLQEKVESFKTKFTSYVQAIDDLNKMDCAADPTGFKASLESARSLQAELIQDSASIHTFIGDTLKVELKVVRGLLQTEQGGVIN